MTPVLPAVAAAAGNGVSVTIGPGDGNPATTVYALRISPPVAGKGWVQTGGLLGSAPVYRTAAAWGTTTVAGLTRGATCTLYATARSGAGIVTEESPGASVMIPVALSRLLVE
jgi:hypothetical protein